MSLLQCSMVLVRFWAKDTKIAFKTINARAETVAEKPSFHSAFKSRRCLVPADCYYEWTKTSDGKQPHRICLIEEGPMSFAGLWERNDKLDMESFTIVTTAAAQPIEHIHNRMPVILKEDAYDAWLSAETAPDNALAMLQPYSVKLITYPSFGMSVTLATRGRSALSGSNYDQRTRRLGCCQDVYRPAWHRGTYPCGHESRQDAGVRGYGRTACKEGNYTSDQ